VTTPSVQSAEKRRPSLLKFALFMIGFLTLMDVIGRTGAFDGVPLLGWGERPGEFTGQWWAATIINNLFVGGLSALFTKWFMGVESEKKGRQA
jgi:hypothetical protein